MEKQLKDIRSGILRSYSLVFFSDNPWFSLLLIAASFIDPQIGLAGLLGVVLTVCLAVGLGLNTATIGKGTYTYNVLLTGLAMGAYFEYSFAFFVVLGVATIFTLFISVWLSGLMTRYKLPILSLPFMLGVWLLLLNTRMFELHLLIPRTGLYTNRWNSLLFFLNISIENNLPYFLTCYLKAMSGIFFQHSLIAGILMSMGLLVHSRISFVLSWIGFLCGMLFFRFTQGNVPGADFEGASLNYIFTAIALGAFFYVPSTAVFLLVIFSTCITAFLVAGVHKMTEVLFLPAYSLPFSGAVVLIIAVLNNRLHYWYIQPVIYQQNSPEKNLYAYHIYMERFSKNVFTGIQLPFYGEWTVSQGHSGKITHKDDFRYAWDFVVSDEDKKTFRMPGKNISDFYCYGLPVTAPADGQVVSILNGIEDNAVGGVNLADNWGNSIVIKHSEFLYSKISHIKNDSFKVKEGDQVKRGDLIAACGNSGRSPEPHIHFQLQEHPYIGAATVKYPLSYYVVKSETGNELHSFDFPKEEEILFRPVTNHSVRKAFEFIPGMKLRFEVNDVKGMHTEEWEVITDISNNSYIHCKHTDSIAYFHYNDTLFYFTSFTGDKKSLLFHFYLAAYKILFSPEAAVTVRDLVPVELFSGKAKKWLMDFISPFYIFRGPQYHSKFVNDPEADSGSVTISSQTGTNGDTMTFSILLHENKIKKITSTFKTLCITATTL